MRSCPKSRIMMSSQNDTTTSLLSNSERFHPSLQKSKSLPFMLPSTSRNSPQQSNRIERGKSAILICDNESRLLFSTGTEGKISSLRDDTASDTAMYKKPMNHNSVISRSNSRSSGARLVEGNQKNFSFFATVKSSAKDYDETISSRDSDRSIGRASNSSINQRTSKDGGSGDENRRRRNSSGSSISGILTPISVTDISSHSSDSITGKLMC